MATTGNAELDGYIAEYTAEIAALTHVLFDKMQMRIPGATVMGYDYYTALAIGWSPDDQTSHGVLSLALYPRWINLCFLRGVELPDPHKLMTGGGNQLRTIRVTDPDMLDDPRVDALIGSALARSRPSIDATRTGRVIIRGVSDKKRPRRP